MEQILSLLWRAEGDGFDDGSDEKVHEFGGWSGAVHKHAHILYTYFVD